MYLVFFNMKNMPFVRSVPVSALYAPPEVLEALARLGYTAEKQQFAVVSGDSGVGKSTLIRKFEADLPKDQYILLYLSDSKLTPRWFYGGLLDQLGMEARFYRGDSKRLLQKEIELIRGIQHKKVVCVLDEAHLLERETLEEFRFMLNYRFDSESPMALILVGQTELWDQKLRLQRYAAIRQRIDVNIVLHTIDHATRYNAKDPDSLKALYRRLYSDIPDLPPLNNLSVLPGMTQFPADLKGYDEFLGKAVSA